jgi:hypothetical protein
LKKRHLFIVAFLLCVLTLSYFTALITVQVNGAASDAKILSHTWYQAPTNELAMYEGDLIVVGELQNVGTTNIFSVYVVGSAYIGDVEVARVSRQVFGNNLLPGQKAPFYLDFAPGTILIENLEDWADVTNVHVTVGHLVNSADSMYQGLTVSSEGDYRSGVYTVVGKVENVGTQSIGDVRVITTFYNADGKVVSLNYTEVFPDKFEPAASKIFTATPVDYYSGDIASYSILIQSTIQQPVGTNPTNNPSNTKNPSNSATAPATTTAPKSSFELTRTTIIVIVVIILSIISIAAVLIMSNRKKHK